MNTTRFIDLLQRIAIAGALTLVTACSTVLYQANGEYIDEQDRSRRILMQWEAQKYYIPFVNADVDTGSVSLQAECLPDVLLDFRDDEAQGFVFVERPQFFKLAAGSADVRIGNFLVCASFAGKQSIEELSDTEEARLLVLCEPKAGEPFLPPNLAGYPLRIEQAETEETLLCQ